MWFREVFDMSATFLQGAKQATQSCQDLLQNVTHRDLVVQGVSYITGDEPTARNAVESFNGMCGTAQRHLGSGEATARFLSLQCTFWSSENLQVVQNILKETIDGGFAWPQALNVYHKVQTELGLHFPPNGISFGKNASEILFYSELSNAFRHALAVSSHDQLLQQHHLLKPNESLSFRAQVSRVVAIPDKDILAVRAESAPGSPAFCLALDRANEAVVLSIRGTSNIADCLTDLANQDGASRHVGINGAANSILMAIRSILIQHLPGRKLILAGHSLGGGVATLMALRICDDPELSALLGLDIEELKKTPISGTRSHRLHCFAFGAPCTVGDGQPWHGHVITSIVYGKDIICRFSMGSGRKLGHRTKLFWTAKVEVDRPNGMEVTRMVDRLQELIPMKDLESRNEIRSIFQQADRLVPNQKMATPGGQILCFIPEDCWESLPGPDEPILHNKWLIRRLNPIELTEILVDHSTFEHHMLSSYAEVFIQPNPNKTTLEDQAKPNSPLALEDQAKPTSPLALEDQAKPASPLALEDQAKPTSPLALEESSASTQCSPSPEQCLRSPEIPLGELQP